MSDLYLLGYNLFSLAVWTNIFVATCLELPAMYSGAIEVKNIYETVAPSLFFVQSTMVLEVIHPLLGLTRTPVSSAAIQVFSRIVVLYGFTSWCETCHNHISFISMVFAWSMIEVFRYSFYALNCAKLEVPGPIFWARYTLFVVLYPLGISGEVGQMLTALPELMKFNPVAGRATHVLLFLYVPFSPYMIYNMYTMRKRAYRNRNTTKQEVKQEKKLPEGLIWPVTDAKTGERSTTVTNKQIWMESLVGIDDATVEKMKKKKNWRFGYVPFVVENVKVCLSSPENALKVARNGLKFARETFVFVRNGKEMKPNDAMKNIKDSFFTGVIEGKGQFDPSIKVEGSKKLRYELPYLDRSYYESEAKELLYKWTGNGTIEKSTADSIANVLDHPEWIDLRDKYFVLLGATSAMGPLKSLLKHGANIIAIDLDREGIWKSLIEQARNSPGKLIFPLSKPQNKIASDEELYKCAGANLLAKTPEIANWLSEVEPTKDITIGNYTYLDGALHVQLSLASDLIMEQVSERRKTATSIAFLCTPTDVHCIPKEAADAAAVHYEHVPYWQRFVEKACKRFGFKNQLIRNVEKPIITGNKNELEVYYVNGIVTEQGPNYALAKRMQHWRCVIAHQNGQIVSSNVAPSTATKSVVSNASFAAAYDGFKLFQCMEVFYQETSSAVMLALLINDLRNAESVSNLKAFSQEYKFKNPFRLFEVNGFHGGVWRCPYTVGSIGVTAAVYHYFTVSKIAVVSIGAILIGTVNYVVKGDVV